MEFQRHYLRRADGRVWIEPACHTTNQPALERQLQRDIANGDAVEVDVSRLIDAELLRLRDHHDPDEDGACMLCGKSLDAHDEVDQRCPNPDGTL